MDYNQVYYSYYNKYYNGFEKKIKKKFIDSKSTKANFGMILNEILHYLDFEIPKRTVINKNEDLKSLLTIFKNRHSYFEEDEIQEILKNVIKDKFNNLNAHITEKYTFDNFIREIALLNVSHEIRRLLQNHNMLFEMFYKTKMFDEFEIRDYRGIGLEQSEIYIRLNKILNPEYYDNLKAISTSIIEIDSEPLKIQKKQSEEIETIKFNLSKFSEDEKIFLLHVCYNTRIKLPQTEFLKLMLITSGISDISLFHKSPPGNNKVYRKFNEGIESIAESKNREFINNIIQKIQFFNLKSFTNELNLIKKSIK